MFGIKDAPSVIDRWGGALRFAAYSSEPATLPCARRKKLLRPLTLLLTRHVVKYGETVPLG